MLVCNLMSLSPVLFDFSETDEHKEDCSKAENGAPEIGVPNVSALDAGDENADL